MRERHTVMTVLAFSAMAALLQAPQAGALDHTQGESGSLLAITPPPDCTLQLKDDAQACTAFLKKCTPGTRPTVEFPTRFIDHGDGTVTDTRTGLMWEQKTDDGSIHDKDNSLHLVDRGALQSGRNSLLHVSGGAPRPERAWGLSFKFGTTFISQKTGGTPVRAVRGGS